MQRSNNKGLVGLFLLVGVLFLIFMLLAVFTAMQIKKGVGGFDSGSSSIKAPIAVVEVKGVILESEKTIKLLHRAEKAEKVKAIILRIDSPGGAVGPTQEIYEEIRRIDAKKPVYASFGAIAASGGYYLGAATRKIYANPGTLTGSIGVILQFLDMSKLYEFVKINPEVIKSGIFKDIGSPSRSLTKDEEELLKQTVRRVHRQFRQDILKTRKDKIQGNLDEHTQGQIFTGEYAKNIGLVDELGNLWTLGRAIHKELKLEGDFELEVLKEKKEFNVMELVDNIEHSMSQVLFQSGLGFIPMLLYRS